MKRILIINAIIWAAVILITSYLYSSTEDYKVIFGVLITAAGLQNAIIYDAFKKKWVK